jgi:hypothetical protein
MLLVGFEPSIAVFWEGKDISCLRLRGHCYRHFVHLLDENIDIIQKNMETLLGASKKVCLEVNLKNSK